jgi:hypothetical protein
MADRESHGAESELVAFPAESRSVTTVSLLLYPASSATPGSNCFRGTFANAIAGHRFSERGWSRIVIFRTIRVLR